MEIVLEGKVAIVTGAGSGIGGSGAVGAGDAGGSATCGADGGGNGPHPRLGTVCLPYHPPGTPKSNTIRSSLNSFTVPPWRSTISQASRFRRRMT